MAILVTGAAGFVGLNVTEHLLRAGQEVVGLDRIDLPARARREFPRLAGRLTMIGGSVLSHADLARALTIGKVETVIHCAVITAGSAREQSNPEGIVAVNVQGAVDTLIAAARRGVQRFVYPSSQSVYGASLAGRELADEDTPRRPLLLYGMTKLACEDMLPRIAETQGVSFVSARLSSVYGPWEYATGARDTLSPMLTIIDLAHRGEEAVLGPSGLGDFVYSADVAAGLAALAALPAPKRRFYNLGSGRRATADDFCRAVQAIRPEFRWRRAAQGETANVVSWFEMDRAALDTDALSAETGVTPRQFDQTAADYLAWAVAG